jgi:outer membrane protein, heavy metal efflux system
LLRVLPIFGMLLLAFSLEAKPQGPVLPVVTIDQAVAEAIENSPTLLAARLGVPVAEAALITAGLRPNPVFSYSSDYLSVNGYNTSNSAGPPESAVRVDFPFERGHKRELRLSTAGYETQIARAQLLDAARRLRMDVTLACIDVLEAKARVALANDNLKALDGIVQLNQTRLTGGAIAPVELTRSRVAMLQFRTSVKTAELALLTSRTKLQTLLGRSAADPLVDVDGQMKAPLPERYPTLAEIQAAAANSRPDLQAVRLEQARSRSDLRLQIAQGKVDFTFGVEYKREWVSRAWFQGVDGRANSIGVSFSAPLPVFNRNQGEIARVTREELQIAKKIDALQAQVTGEVTTAYQEFENARQLVAEIESDLLKPSEEARATVAYVYQAGASSLIDVLDAQRAYNETMSAYYDAQADYRRAATKLALVAGLETIP